MIAALVVLTLAASSPTAAQAEEPALKALYERSGLRWQPPTKKVLAFYYPWYGSLDFGGRWQHWEDVDVARKRIGSSTHYPQLGPYDSLDPRVVERHCVWSKGAGIDGWIVSWWGKGHRTDRAMALILDQAARHGLAVTAYHETLGDPPSMAHAIGDVKYLIERYGSHRAWLREQGKPVVFVYGRSVGQIGIFNWAQAAVALSQEVRGGVLIVGDSLSSLASRAFDGVHTYITAGDLKGKSPTEAGRAVEDVFARPLERADAGGRIGCVTIIPGYDDTRVRRPGLVVSRFEGASYRAQWEAALRLNPDWILITSFNEWHEGTEIEPSEEHGDRYLRITAEFAPRFRALPPRRKAAASPRAAARWSEVVAKLGPRPAGLLPDPGSLAAPWLAGVGGNLRRVSWEEIAAGLEPSKVPLLVFAGGETYKRTVVREGDVEEGLRRYVERGGALLVAGAEPLPLYYDERGRTVDSLARIGLRVAAGGANPPRGFENPPAGLKLEFEFDRRVCPEAPERAPFPRAADPRWRPALDPGPAAGERLMRVATLRDEKGRDWGAGAAVLDRGDKGRIGYVWFNLLDEPYGEALLASVIRLLLPEAARSGVLGRTALAGFEGSPRAYESLAARWVPSR